MSYQPKTGQACGCRRGVQRDNCAACEGTGERIDFAKIRAGMIEQHGRDSRTLQAYAKEKNDLKAELKKVRAVAITAGEWEEIYACLIHKYERVKAGDYRLAPSKDQSAECFAACVREENREQKKWLADLKRLIEKIGPDGENMKREVTL